MAAGAPYSLPAWQAIVKAAGVGAGTRVLDVGCGTGGFSEVAAAAGATVSGIDVDEAALAVARQRVPTGDFRAGRMGALPWEDRAFDVVAGINAFQYADDPAAALAEARRVTRPGGAVALCKWGAPQDNELFTILGAALRLAGKEAPAGEPADAFAALRPAIAAARLEVRQTGAVPVVLELADAAALEAALLGSGAMVGASELRAAAAPFVQPDGSYRLRNLYRYLVAVV